MTQQALMVGLGEVLWDMLPSGKVLGGAPANFAYMANVLGDEGVVASRVGSDRLGQEAHQQLQRLGLRTNHLQRDSRYETGTAEVSIDAGGQPTFIIREPVAWDRLQWTADWEKLSSQADVICFGSLAQRSAVSFDTIDRFLRGSRPDALRILDVNLRQSYYSVDVLSRSLEHANIVKLTQQELTIVASMLGMKPADEKRLARTLIREWRLKLVCITRGACGSVLISERECIGHPGVPVQVVDAVGAGDAFTACLAHHFVRGHSLSEISGYANHFASWVATQVGATPVIHRPQVQDLLQNAGATGGTV